MKNLVLIPLLAALSLLGCKRIIEEKPERVESFAVTFNFDPAVQSAAGCGTTLPDVCHNNVGSPEQPLPYAQNDYVSYFVDIEAIGSKGTKPFKWNGDVAFVLPRGTLHMQMAPVSLVDGKLVGAHIRMRRIPGVTTIFVEDRLEGRNETAPTFAVGASEKLYFAHPDIPEVQTTDNERYSSLHKNRVSLTSGLMIVTRVGADGFNVTDVTKNEWNSIFAYAYNGVEGIVPGSQILLLEGGITEFLGTTQVDSPQFASPHIRCETEIGHSEGAEDTEVDEGGMAVVARCPTGTTCTQVEEERHGSKVRLHRCVPDQNPDAWDKLGRIKCSQANDPICPNTTTCEEHAEDQGWFCQAIPYEPVYSAWPRTGGGRFPYCGPVTTGRDPPLTEEMAESRLVTLSSADGTLRVEGLPICKHVDDITSVGSSCHLSDDVPDCTLARAGEPLLRDYRGAVCYRYYQACKDTGLPYTAVQSTCVLDPTLPYCETALPGEPVLRNNNDVVCRNTMDQFIWGGWEDYNQWKVTFEDPSGDVRCATIIADAVAGFDPFVLQEGSGTLQSVTGTLKQVIFTSGSSFWSIQVRDESDIVY